MHYTNEKSLKQLGFTLFELMTVLAIVAIMAAIAIPSYKAYFIKNSESEVKAKMLKVALQAKRYRAKNLNYLGFQPESGYVDSAKKEICVPTNSNCKYKLNITDKDEKSLTNTSSGAQGANGNSWFMFAKPEVASLKSDKTKKFILRSDGTSCAINGTDTDYLTFTYKTSCDNKDSWEE